jgi:hypothetical protein
MKKRKDSESIEMRAHYDFSGGVRGKYAGRIRGGGKVVILDADVAKLFPDSRSVNHALRTLAEVFKGTSRKSKR